MDKTDVAIVGCGIAGGICALKLLKEGYNVRVIDKVHKIGSHNQKKIDITENTSLLPIIKDLKLDFLDKSSRSKWFSPNNSFLFESKIYDLFVKRGSEKDSFDTKLSDKIEEFGVKIETNSIFKDFHLKDDLISSMKMKTKNRIKEVEAKFFVGADGSDSVTLKKLHLNRYLRKCTEIIGYGLVSKELNIPERETNVFFNTKLIPAGYFFVAKTRKELCVASIVTNILSDVKPLNYFSGSCTLGLLKKRTYSNFCAVGDAAYVMDPLFAYGVRPAIISGYLAAEAIKYNLENERCDLLDYELALREYLLSKEKLAFFLRRLFCKMNNRDLDFLVESANYLHKRVHLDDLLDKPQKHLCLITNWILRNPMSSGRLGTKILMEMILSS